MSSICSRTITLTLLLAAVAPSMAADGPDVRELMTPEEFRAAGLDKLSPEELQALNHWMIRYTAKDAPEVRHSSETVKQEIQKVETEGVRTRIVGEFRGWEGNTVFQLENGQVWRQRLAGRWYYRAESPEVVLRKNVVGFWVMEIVAAGRSVGVTRVN